MSSKLLLTMLFALLWGCGGFERGDPLPESAGDDTGSSDTDDNGSPSFATTVEPVLAERCSSCHGSGGVASGTRFALSGDAASDYTNVSELIDTSAPADSRLLSKATGVSHGGGAVFTTDSTDYQTILDWISGGAAP